MFSKIVIANRGEVALRVVRACRKLGIDTVGLYSEADRQLMHLRLVSETICIGPAAPMESYLRDDRILAACSLVGADALHPGWGFLSENPKFIRHVEEMGIKFIGPRAETAELMGDKITAKETAAKYGMPTLPGSDGPLPDKAAAALKVAEKIGFPVILKATAGGGGKGMRVVYEPSDFHNQFDVARREAYLSYRNDKIYAEKFLPTPRHLEVQILGDGKGGVLIFGDRDCSTQRRYQKVVEEAPAPNIPQEVRRQMHDSCRQVASAIKYEGAGTFEFLYQSPHFYFLEMNTRLQVEHTVTEMTTGIDLVEEQIRVAAGLKPTIKQEDILTSGHAIECRLNAEDSRTQLPSPGEITFFHAPAGPGIRMDSHIYAGYHVPTAYDSLIGKIVAHGSDREEACRRMLFALEELEIQGISCNAELLSKIIASDSFAKVAINVNSLESMLASFWHKKN